MSGNADALGGSLVAARGGGGLSGRMRLLGTVGCAALVLGIAAWALWPKP